jgi:hypothetical protein
LSEEDACVAKRVAGDADDDDDCSFAAARLEHRVDDDFEEGAMMNDPIVTSRRFCRI